MRISTLIQQLQQIQAKHGDLIVGDWDDRLLTLEYEPYPRVFPITEFHLREKYPSETEAVAISG